jgi:positive regulator of sigma E activity
MTAEAVVRGVDADGTVHVELTQSQACRGCEAVCLWRRLPADAAIRQPVGSGLGPGMQVTISLPAGQILSSALLLHGLPLAGLLGGAVAGFASTGSDLGCLLGGVVGTLLALVAGAGPKRRVEQAALERVAIRPRR